MNNTHIIAIGHQKGGVGKTTTAINLAAALRECGKRVLLIDMDPQASLTFALFGEYQAENIYQIFLDDISKDRLSIDKLIKPAVSIPGIDVVPADPYLALVDQRSDLDIFERLREELNLRINNDRYDFVLIDTSPTMGTLMINSLIAAHHIIIPNQSEFLSEKSLYLFLRLIEKIKKKENPGLEILGIVFTMFDSRRNLDSTIVKAVANYGLPMFKTLIRRRVDIAEAPAKKQSIFQYNPENDGAEDYMSFAREVLQRLGSWDE